MMREYVLRMVGALLLLGIVSSQAFAGQVVTEDVRQWAQDAVAQEQAIKPAPAPNTVAVLYFHNRSQNPQLNPLQKGLAFLLMTDLASVGDIRLVERVKLQALVEELNLGVSGLVEKDSAPRMGKLLGAGYLVGGDIRGSKEIELGIHSNLLQVKGQSTLGQPSAEGMLAQVFELEKKILFEIIDLLKIKLTEDQKERLKKPFTTNYKALIYLSNGLDASDRGNYSRAAIYYHQSLGQDPQFQPAKNALDELRGLGLVMIHPRSDIMLKAQAEQNSSTTSLGNNTPTFREFKPGSNEGQVRVTW